MNSINIRAGERVAAHGKTYKITRTIDLNWVLGEEDPGGKIERLRIADLKHLSTLDKTKDVKEVPHDVLEDKEWELAQKRFDIIKPLLNTRDGAVFQAVSKESGKSLATLYRWIEQYKVSGKVSSLVPLPKGGKGTTRINKEAEEIIKAVIEDTFMQKNKTVQKTCTEVLIRCKRLGIEAPHPNTVRNRILQISEYDKVKGKYGKREAEQQYGAKTGHFPGANFPLSIVQIDHTKLDIIIVDEHHRKPMGRPWITLAIDVYSRMVAGFYISMDPPGTLGTGLCISHSILPKDDIIIKNEIKGEWPCWGVMTCIHLDNAREFHGDSLARSCAEYNIDIAWRRPKTPEMGGHIERLLGTFLKEIHTLPGTTFSNIKERKHYDSVEKAVFTLPEIEKWLATFIVEVYHNRVHSGIGTTPLKKYNEGIFGDGTINGSGIPPRIHDPYKLKMDFLPAIERTIQDYGVLVDHIYYYNDVLRRWINATEPSSGKARIKRKFIFKRDPRNISMLYFLDPDIKEYFTVPYRDIQRPSMSLWEYNEILKDLQKNKLTQIEEDDIFQAYEKLQRIESEAVDKTKFTKRSNLKAFKRDEARRKRVEGTFQTKEESEDIQDIESKFPDEIPEPFDNLDF